MEKNEIIEILRKMKNEEGDRKNPNFMCGFHSPSGSGSTTLLVNTALLIAQESKYEPKICIVDLDLIHPSSVAYKFHQDDLISASKSIFDLAKEAKTLDEEKLLQAFITHEPSGVHILNTENDSLLDIRLINAEFLKEFFSLLKSMFDLILVDTSSDIRQDAASYPLMHSDRIVVTVEPDISSLLRTKNFLDVMHLFEKSMSTNITGKINFVLNKASSKSGIDSYTVEKVLRGKPIAEIPINECVVNLTNNGSAFIDYWLEGKSTLMPLARMLYPFEEESKISPTYIELGKETWVEKYGSEHLKNCIKYGYNAQRLYVEERSKKEFPDFLLDFDNQIKWKERSTPSEIALLEEISLRKRFSEFEVRVEWNDSEKSEYIRIKNYLGKYSLVKKI